MYLTNYHSYQTESPAEKFSNFCLSPLVTAFGRKVTICQSSQAGDQSNLTYKVEKTHHIAIRILAALGAILLLPLTLLGLIVRAASSSNKQHVKYEIQFLEMQKKAKDNAQPLEKQETPIPAPIFEEPSKSDQSDLNAENQENIIELPIEEIAPPIQDDRASEEIVDELPKEEIAPPIQEDQASEDIVIDMDTVDEPCETDKITDLVETFEDKEESETPVDPEDKPSRMVDIAKKLGTTAITQATKFYTSPKVSVKDKIRGGAALVTGGLYSHSMLNAAYDKYSEGEYWEAAKRVGYATTFAAWGILSTGLAWNGGVKS